MTRARINVLFCHGIGNHKASYAKETIQALKEELGKANEAFEFRSVYWGEVLDSRQNLIMNRAIASGDLDWKGLRRELIVGGLGDACAYLGTGDGPSPYYHKIQARVRAGFMGFKKPRLPTVVLCHSMGCAVMMDYLYDHGPHPVQCAVLFGCNLPLFWFGHRPGHIRLPDIRRVYNLYDSDDLLAYPLKGLSERVDKWVTGDYRISTGGIFGAHTGYWADPDFVRWVSRCLRREARL